MGPEADAESGLSFRQKNSDRKILQHEMYERLCQAHPAMNVCGKFLTFQKGLFSHRRDPVRTAGRWSNFEVVSTPGQTPRSGSVPQYTLQDLERKNMKTKREPHDFLVKSFAKSIFGFALAKHFFFVKVEALTVLRLLLGRETCPKPLNSSSDKRRAASDFIV